MTRASANDPGANQDAAAAATDRTGFAAILRERTAGIHREAERAGIIASLIRGRATRQGYALYLRNLIPAYTALETALEASRDEPALRAFADPALYRLPALTRDLAAIVGPGWASSCRLLPEAEAYADAIASAAPAILVAHAYARYLGDLSGGQILKPVLARTLGLGSEALTFYDFPAIADVAAVKLAMRDALDAIPEGRATSAPGIQDAIVEEAIAAFRHNIAVSEAVQAAIG